MNADPTQAQAEGEELDVIERARRLYRALELSANIMRDPNRTGGWEGAERTASAFERQAASAKELHSALFRRAPPAAPSKVVGYALRDTSSGTVEVASGLFRRREAAEAAALRLTNQWKTIGVLPLQTALEE